jgi:hypothetical protein
MEDSHPVAHDLLSSIFNSYHLFTSSPVQSPACSPSGSASGSRHRASCRRAVGGGGFYLLENLERHLRRRKIEAGHEHADLT